MVMLKSVLEEHLRNVPRLLTLSDYYHAKTAITRRERAAGLPNNKIAHPFARYITSVATGYLIGQPASYNAEEQEDALKPITEAFERCTVTSVDAENARHASIYGRGVEYVHVSEQEGAIYPCAVALSPESAFVVYDDDYHNKPMFGVYFTPETKEDGTQDGWKVYVMGALIVREYKMSDLSGSAAEVISENQHYFGDVPMVEYWNDEDEIGDFEWVMPMIDAYDKLESDRINDKEQSVDKLLVLTGCTIEDDDRGRPPWQQLREDKALCLPDFNANAGYLQGSNSESDVEVLRLAYSSDIHKMAMVPDLSDREFAQNASGVAMKYKIWGLEQITSVKEQWFIEGLRMRLRLFAHFCSVQGFPVLDTTKVRITLTRAMPSNMLELAQIVQTAESANAASTETKVRILHEPDNWTPEQVEAEVEKIEAKDAQAMSPLTQYGNMLMGDTTTQLDAEADGLYADDEQGNAQTAILTDEDEV